MIREFKCNGYSFTIINDLLIVSLIFDDDTYTVYIGDWEGLTEPPSWVGCLWREIGKIRRKRTSHGFNRGGLALAHS